MALGPHQIQFDRAEVNTLEVEIDAQLKEVASKCPADRPLTVLVKGDPGVKVQQEIVTRYLHAGWGTVRVLTSRDNGERPGLLAVTFTK